ncbi:MULTISPECIES: aminoglycoside 6-adenylyltransferase [Enterococcus]|uniref:aminoglycoside 6-adenylyltransferase n=1 Tax=Enterococcus TaxID=1350 RepID=UPI00065E8F4D|nr:MULTISPECIES: aminoglycoside 6-adenylyltransferase [Enterococcus]KAF1300196.1 aminoglycoside adenylyltransferase [Enterococcus sp. JM9B]
MRTEQEMLTLILQTAKELPQVVAAAISGSRMNSNVPKDSFQDFDIVYIVNEKKSLLTNRKWLEKFGERLIMQCPEEMTLFPPTLGERFTFLMLFADGNRIDLMLCPFSEIEREIAEEPLLSVLYDPCGIFPQLTSPTDTAFWVKEPTKEEFFDCCNEFWWVSTYVVKGLWRKELLYASDHLYEVCQKELLRLLSWQVAAEKNYTFSVGKNFKYLPKYLTMDQQEQLLIVRDFSSKEKIWQALFKTQAFFHGEALKFAAHQGFFYDAETAEKVMAYSRTWYQETDKKETV